MPINAAGSAEIDILFPQLQKRLIESGDWERIKAILSSRLNETGWIDDMRHRSKEQARGMEPLSFRLLLEDLAPHAQSTLPLAVKREIMAIIRQYVEKQFE